jgi:hypothetical protein
VPNQCHDQHGRGNAGPDCEYDPNDNGTQTGLNPALIFDGDAALEQIIDAIHHSPAWRDGRRSAIITVWDENDYSVAPTTNQVLLIVDTNYGKNGKQSSEFYMHFSLLKSIEAALRIFLPRPFHFPRLVVNISIEVNALRTFEGSSARRGHWRIWEWLVPTHCRREPRRERMPTLPVSGHLPPTKISSLSGKTPTPTFPS